MPSTALLVIDMQNDFIKKNAILEVKGIRKGIKPLSEFIDFCREKKILVIYTRHCYDPQQNIVEAKLFPYLGNKALKKGTDGWQIYDALAPQKGDIVIDKTRYDAFFKTNLHSTLQKHKINKIIVTGTMTEVCCESTARTAMFLDYDVIFCSDLCFTNNKQLHQRTLDVIKSNFGRVKSQEEIKKRL